MKYKKGDIVRVKSFNDIKSLLVPDYDFLQDGANYSPDGLYFAEDEMGCHCGKTFTVVNIDSDGYLILDTIDDYVWLKDWVLPHVFFHFDEELFTFL